MSDPISAGRLRWVTRSDGRLVPFEADRISRDLFAAGERLGQPDAFLARELTDSVVHFLGLEVENAIPSTDQVADVVVKVVRELGYPALAQAFAQRSPPTPVSTERLPGPAAEDVERLLSGGAAPAQVERHLSRTILSEYSLRNVFGPDLAAAHASGLLILGNLDCPAALAGIALDAAELGAGQLAERIQDQRDLAGDWLALDGPEYSVLSTPSDGVRKWVGELSRGLRATGLHAIVNLNSAQAPPGVAERSVGPLFATATPASAERQSAVADALLDGVLACGQRLRVDWHLAERDFQPASAARLLQVARRAAEDAPLCFTFDRPRKPVMLAEGLARRQPATLMTIGLNLPRLAEQPGVAGDPQRLLAKLGSLVRLALSAATQKRDFLRRLSADRPRMTAGFLLERARLVLVPLGLEAVAQRFLGENLCAGGAGLELARQVLRRLGEALQLERRSRYLEAGLDSGDGLAEGITCWDEQADPRAQLRTAGQLHADTRAGTATVVLTHQPRPEELADLLRHAWQHTDVVRARFTQLGQPAGARQGLWAE